MVGLGVFDYICQEHYDPLTGETYEAMTSCNNEEMADRCKVKSANKAVWCIKATADFNSNAATALRAAIKNGNINLLSTEFDAEENIKKTPNWNKMSSQEQSKIQLPYVQTSMLINEMINLEHEIVNNKVKLKERTGMRKDRFSSFEYNNWIIQQLGLDLKHKSFDEELVDVLSIRPARKVGSFTYKQRL